MKPVRTASSNFVYMGPTPEIGDLHCERIRVGEVRSVWTFTPDERRAIAEGANLQLDILTEPIPPVSLGLTDEKGVGEDAPEILDRLATWQAAHS